MEDFIIFSSTSSREFQIFKRITPSLLKIVKFSFKQLFELILFT